MTMLYRNFGEYEKAVQCANHMPEIKHSREMLLTAVADGKEEAKYIGDALLKMAANFAKLIVYGLVNNSHHYESDMPIEKIKGTIAIFNLICDDGNFGEYNGVLIELYLYLSRVQWERGYHDEAFESLDKGYEHAKELEKLYDGKTHYFTAPLVKYVKCAAAGSSESLKITANLPEDWPFWCNPDYSQVEKEIKADPRWDKWVKKCRG